jgi:predicted DsbA family dithiol-disulfide isomerase
MRVDVWVDLVCPWCFVGKRRFERALAAFEHRTAVQVVHRSFQLDPTLPPGKAFGQTEILQSKYGMSSEQAREAQTRLERLAAGEGIELRLTDGLTGNTFDAHRLVHLAKQRGLEDAAMERFYRAHFSEQRSLFDHPSLIELGVQAGLDRDEVERVLAGDDHAASVRADAAEAQALGARGVPFFVFDHRAAVSGAQPPEVFAQVLTRAWAQASAAAPLAARGGSLVED